jgi:predicted DCC family thiol-disulfide oxidoreductase YuxK
MSLPRAGVGETISAYAKPLVFYDGGCSLCRREIGHYQRIDRRHRLDWVDISREPERVHRYGLTVAAAMQRLHVLDADGDWQTGVAGFIELWAHLPYYRRLASLLRALHMVKPLDIVYGCWSRWRAKHRCGSDRCEIS